MSLFQELEVRELTRAHSGAHSLLLHGTKDETVPTADVGYYANALTGPGRRPGSCKLHLVDDANHNFKGW